MSKATKIWLITAASLILIGCILFGGAMTMHRWDLTKLSTSKYEMNNFEINENYKNISIVTDTADILLVASENSKSYVECYEQKNVKHSIEIENDTLVIEVVDTRKWYEHIGINFGSPKITVYIPQGEYGNLSVKSDTGRVEIPKDLSFESIDISENTGDVTNYASASEDIKIKTTTGDIYVENISAGSLDLSVSTGKATVSGVKCDGDVKISVSTGDAKLTDVSCESLFSNGNTGGISLNNVIATGKLSIERSTGNVKFEKCDASEIFIKTDTGDVDGTLLSDKIFITITDTGRVSVPASTTGGRCEITTDTGDVKINIQK